jgi:GAF domain-containing protein
MTTQLTTEQEQIKRYQRLIDVIRDLASTLDLDELLQRIISLACELSDAQAASILLYDEATRQLYFQATTNIEEPLIRGITSPWKAAWPDGLFPTPSPWSSLTCTRISVSSTTSKKPPSIPPIR